jgi:hypothetical protein
VHSQHLHIDKVHPGVMSTDHVTFDNPGWGSPEPAPRGWGRRETAVAVGIAAVIDPR